MWTWNIMKLSSSCKRKTKQRTYPTQLIYKHHCKLFGCWNLGIMEHFLWMQPLVPMCKGIIFSPRWCLTIIVKVYRSSMGNHKSANKIGLNTMVTSIEKPHLERGSLFKAFMFHCKWCLSRVWCNQVQHTIYLPYPILFYVILFSRVVYKKCFFNILMWLWVWLCFPFNWLIMFFHIGLKYNSFVNGW